MTLKFTWNVHEINLHLAFNWDLNVLEVWVTQFWWFCHWILGTPRPVQYWRPFLVLNVTSNNISVISWWSVLLVKETRVPGENQRHVASHWHGFFDLYTAMNGIWTYNFSDDRHLLHRYKCSCKSNYYTIMTTIAPSNIADLQQYL